MLRTSKSVLSTIAASAADITQGQGYLSITGCPPMKYSQINNAGLGYILKATEYQGSVTVTPTATVGTASTLIITQYNGQIGSVVSQPVSYTPVTGDSATTICNAWRAQLALLTGLNVTGSGTSTFIVTAKTSTSTNPYRSATIGVQSVSGVNTVAVTAAGTVSVISSTDATPVVVTTAASTYAVGQLITISGHTTNVAANGTFLITATNGTTTVTLGNQYTGTDVAGSGAGAGASGTLIFGVVGATSNTASNVIVGNQSRGAYWDLIADGISASDIAVGKTYNQIIFQYRTSEGGAMLESAINQHTMYVQDDATNFASFRTRMNEIVLDYTASATTADPKNLQLV